MDNLRGSLNDKVAIITGADSGIGRACAIELSSLGENIPINYQSDQKSAEETLGIIEKNGGKGLIFKTDVGDYAQVQQMFTSVKDRLGIPWILVNSAGVNESGIFADDMDIEVFDCTMRTNIYGIFYTCKPVVHLDNTE